MSSWSQWCEQVTAILKKEWGIEPWMLTPEPPLVDWWIEGVSPRAAARWATSCDVA